MAPWSLSRPVSSGPPAQTAGRARAGVLSDAVAAPRLAVQMAPMSLNAKGADRCSTPDPAMPETAARTAQDHSDPAGLTDPGGPVSGRPTVDHPRPPDRPGAHQPGDPGPPGQPAVAGGPPRRHCVGAQCARRRAGHPAPRSDRQDCTIRELPAAEPGPILQRYIRIAPATRPYFQAGKAARAKVAAWIEEVDRVLRPWRLPASGGPLGGDAGQVVAGHRPQRAV